MVAAILNQELLCNHSCYDRFTETHHIGKEKTIVADEFLIAFNDRIHLIIIFGVAFWHVKRVIIVGFQYAVRKILHKHLDIQVVR